MGRCGVGAYFADSVIRVLGRTRRPKVLVINGWQLITTLTLPLVTLAEFARDNPDGVTHFSCEEILGSGGLVSPNKKDETAIV